MSQLAQLTSNLGRVSRRKLIASIVLALAIGGLLLASFSMLNKPVLQILYSNLDAEDVNRTGSALSEVGINFDVNEAGSAVLVEPGKAAQARMILASKGLPKSDKSGYELFDQMGSLGLTSFMQQVTKVRALEGELVRTIQQLEGIKSARVHLALKSEGAFRNREEKPSASVVVRAAGTPDTATANAIRQIVAAAIPGLTSDQVVVSTTDGQILASPSGGVGAEPSTMLELEQKVASETQLRVVQTLAPIAGLSNFRVSVSAKIDMDKRQVKETSFDPESKVERSMRTVKTVDQSSGASNSQQVSADQNIPREVGATGGGDASAEKKESKEELVNYEVASKQTETVSAGYEIKRLSVAVVLNNKSFLPGGGAALDDAQIQAKRVEIEELVKSAAGLDAARGDIFKVSFIDFVEDAAVPEQGEGGGIMDVLLGNLGTIINALALIVSIVLVLLLGLRPAMKLILERREADPQLEAAQAPKIAAEGQVGALPDPAKASVESGADGNTSIPIEKLNRIVGIDVDRAAQVLKRWLDQPVKDAA